ncbi:MAG: hypothetical protein NC094_05100 [Bacteroidales bacterium]|nr:hypothetical protein [Lachnoclostridium sp.]MCM1384279.1 hypothetical protein [Lachnoclostridium sp.]MCM1464778.1 hypothetical protein [Bacteroidales bacterium]
MLGKLIKHEWKRISKLNSLLLVIMLAFTALECLLFFTPMTDFVRDARAFSRGDIGVVLWFMVFVASVIACIMLMVGLTYGNMIYIGVNFEKTMYSDEGYLTHTLPVTPHQLLFSKFLVGGLWTMIIYFVMMVCIVVLATAFGMAVTGGADFGEILYEVQKILMEVLSQMSTEGAVVLTHYLIAFIVLALAGPFCTVAMLFGALTLGQLSAKHKGLMGILIYFGITMANSVLTNIVSNIGRVITMAGRSYDANAVLFFTMDVAIIFQVLIAVCLYFLSHYIIVKKLNLN